ncbi:MAG: hypothetical protein K0S79_1063 [Nitrospira sp.]|jgi:hypothetical protein|nr:hypothetical protein [Nitrospira sp.]
MVPLLASCALPREITKTPRSAIEQLLLTQALNRSLLDLRLPVSPAEPLYMKVSGLQLGYMSPLLPLASGSSATATPPTEGYFSPAGDLAFISDAVASHLAVLGYRLSTHEDEAAYLVRVVVQSFGTVQATSFFGMPPIQSVLIPFSLPQLTIYQNLSQDGYIRYGVEVVERASRRLVYTTPWHSHRTYHDQYTILFFFSFRMTDLDEAP